MVQWMLDLSYSLSSSKSVRARLPSFDIIEYQSIIWMETGIGSDRMVDLSIMEEQQMRL
jgi:hypothetical protein